MANGLLFNISRFFGLSMYNSDGKFDRYLMCWSISYLFMGITISIVSKAICYFDPTERQESGEFMSNEIWNFQQSLNLVCICYHVYSNVHEKHKLEHIMMTVRTVGPGVYDKTYTIIGSCIVVSFSGLWYIHTPDFWDCVNYLCNILSIHATSLVLLQFCSVLNRLSAKLNDTKRDIKSFRVNYFEHSRLIALAEDANRVYDVQLLLICSNIFCSIVTSAYSCYGHLKSPVAAQHIHLIALVLLSISLKIFMLFWLTATCEAIDGQADSFNMELFSLLRRNRELCENDTLLMYVLVRQSVTITACGFFNIGHSLVTSIAAGATTYLVILIQFSGS